MLLTYLDEQQWLALSEAQQKDEIARCQPHVQRLLRPGREP